MASTQMLLLEFRPRCATALEGIGDMALSDKKHDEAVASYSTALSLSLPTSSSILMKWTSTMLVVGSVNEIPGAASKVGFSRYSEFGPRCYFIFSRPVQASNIYDLSSHMRSLRRGRERSRGDRVAPEDDERVSKRHSHGRRTKTMVTW